MLSGHTDPCLSNPSSPSHGRLPGAPPPQLHGRGVPLNSAGGLPIYGQQGPPGRQSCPLLSPHPEKAKSGQCILLNLAITDMLAEFCAPPGKPARTRMQCLVVSRPWIQGCAAVPPASPRPLGRALPASASSDLEIIGGGKDGRKGKPGHPCGKKLWIWAKGNRGDGKYSYYFLKLGFIRKKTKWIGCPW